MSVKEVVQSLVDDGIVDSEKIGTSIYFWAFPSKASQNRKRKMDDLEAQLKELGNKKQQLLEASKKAKLGKEKSDEREEVLEELNKRRLEREEILKELEKYKDSDPEVLKQINEESNTAKDAANRWTDNIFSTKAWIKNKFCLDDSVVDNTFGISSDLDYLE
uniref:Meiotic nuclear division protein 1 homolog n=1 Tax=Arion vulgaris TaxID=1028688 RepID=A0A0B6Z7W0_9EUPU